MVTERKKTVYPLLAAFLCLLAILAHYLLDPWGFYRKVSEEEAALRLSLVAAAESYLGCNESDGSHRPIIDRYNAQEILPVGYTMQYTDSWCAAFVTASALEAGLTDIIPPECGCERQIEAFKILCRWEENDNAIPQPGDLIYYDWDVKHQGDSTGWSDHVGIVAGVKWPFIKVIEGNKNDDVSCRILPIGHKTIRGYGLPAYE
jgi:hypothetical protein